MAVKENQHLSVTIMGQEIAPEFINRIGGINLEWRKGNKGMYLSLDRESYLKVVSIATIQGIPRPEFVESKKEDDVVEL